MANNQACVFCGGAPTAKNKEHPIPQWAIEATGDPNRVVNITTNLVTGEIRRFAFDQLVLPACTACNEKWGKLEAKAKYLVGKLQSGDGLDRSELSMLLDWLDKVRVGTWLAMRIHSATPIEPSFYIERRVASADRMLSVVRVSDGQGLRLLGTGQPLFVLMPSCFCLQFNDLFIFNASTNFLFSKDAGWPYPHKMDWVTGDERVATAQMSPGTHLLANPSLMVPSKDTVLEFLPLEEVPAIYQVVGDTQSPSGLSELWDTEWIRAHTLDREKGLGVPISTMEATAEFMTESDLFKSTVSPHPSGITGTLWTLQTLRTQIYAARLELERFGKNEFIEACIGYNERTEELLS